MEEDEKGNNIIRGYNEDKERLKKLVNKKNKEGNVIFYDDGYNDNIFKTSYNESLELLKRHLDKDK